VHTKKLLFSSAGPTSAATATYKVTLASIETHKFNINTPLLLYYYFLYIKAGQNGNDEVIHLALFSPRCSIENRPHRCTAALAPRNFVEAAYIFFMVVFWRLFRTCLCLIHFLMWGLCAVLEFSSKKATKGNTHDKGRNKFWKNINLGFKTST
jgi:hypothetical protein